MLEPLIRDSSSFKPMENNSKWDISLSAKEKQKKKRIWDWSGPHSEFFSVLGGANRHPADGASFPNNVL